MNIKHYEEAYKQASGLGNAARREYLVKTFLLNLKIETVEKRVLASTNDFVGKDVFSFIDYSLEPRLVIEMDQTCSTGHGRVLELAVNKAVLLIDPSIGNEATTVLEGSVSHLRPKVSYDAKLGDISMTLKFDVSGEQPVFIAGNVVFDPDMSMPNNDIVSSLVPVAK